MKRIYLITALVILSCSISLGASYFGGGGGKRTTIEVVNQVDRGNWSTLAHYSSNSRYRHLVTYADGNRYTAMSNNNGQTPSVSSQYWAVAIAKGDTGAPGATGPQGERGFQGYSGEQGATGPTGAASTVPGPAGEGFQAASDGSNGLGVQNNTTLPVLQNMTSTGVRYLAPRGGKWWARTGEGASTGSWIEVGSGSAVIDDTKGNGDTAFTWSADKIFDELTIVSAGAPLVSVPTYSDTACTAGTYSQDTTYFYVCRASGDWRRIAWGTWSNPTPVASDMPDSFSTNTASNYTAINGGVSVAGGVMLGTAWTANNTAYYNTSTSSANNWCSMVVTTVQNDGVGCLVRVAPGSPTTGYMMRTHSGNAELFSFTGSTATWVATMGNATEGDTIRLNVSGTGFTYYRNGASTWTGSGSTYSAGNYIGVLIDNANSGTSATIDDFNGGAL